MSRRRAPWWQILAAVAFLVVAYVVVGDVWGAGSEDGADPNPSVPRAQGEEWHVTRVIDGDTLDVTRGGVTERVRLIGINAPEREECGYDEATAALADAVLREDVFLVPGTRNDRDVHGRLLRFVELEEPDGTRLDVGWDLIDRGLAEARYDSRTGQPHDREEIYWRADEASPALCG